MLLNTTLAVCLLAVVAFYLIRALSKPLKEMGKVMVRSAAAGFIIWGVNVLGDLFGFHIGLNFLSAFTVGLLGIPGAALILALKVFLL